VHLYVIAKKFPEIKIYGVDISGKAIKTGNEFFRSKGIKNVFLKQGNIGYLRKFEDKSIDMIFSDTAMIYFGPAEVCSALKEMARVGKKAIILCEPNNNIGKSYYNDRWVHDYKAIFEKTILFKSINVIKLSENIWSSDWASIGAIIEVLL